MSSGPGAIFATTHWTVVLAAGRRGVRNSRLRRSGLRWRVFQAGGAQLVMALSWPDSDYFLMDAARMRQYKNSRMHNPVSECSAPRQHRSRGLRLALGVLAYALAFVARAQTCIVEPDDYPDGTVLDHLLPAVHLTSAGADNLPIPPVPFEVTAVGDLLDFATTGTNVFACANVPFWNSDQRLRMEFAAPVSSITIDFAGGQYFTNETGRLDGYNAAGQLVASYVTAPQAAGHAETMTISREATDIAWAVAYVPPGLGVFGRLDNLRFGVVPRPVLQLSMANGIAVLTFAGSTNLTYRVWASTNLSNWQVLGAPTQGQPGQFVFADVVAIGNPHRFYRVSLP